MKKIYAIILFAALPFFAKAQTCTVFVQWTNVSCFGNCDGTAMAFPNGTAPFIYSWAPTACTAQTCTNLCPGSYTVTMIDANGCTATATVMITEPSQMQCATSVVQPASCSTCCDGQAVGTATGGNPPYAYTWMPNGITTSSANNLCPGTYTFCATDANGCVCCDTVTVGYTTGVSEVDFSTQVNVSPNPAINSVTISITKPEGEISVSIYDVLGNVMLRRENLASENAIDVTAWAPGVYLVVVKNGSQTAVSRFVKE
jgi:hypothetical protein